MGGFDMLLSGLFRHEIETQLGVKTMNKIEKRLFEKYGMTLSETMTDFEKLYSVITEFFGNGSRGMIRSILSNVCKLERATGRRNSIITLHDPILTEKVLEMLGDKDYRRILDMLMDKPLAPLEIVERLDIPQASAYRKIERLTTEGLLIEDKKNLGRNGRPAVKITTLYQGLDMNIIKNKVTVHVKISQDMLKKSTIFSTLYSVG